MARRRVVVLSNVSAADRQALGDILNRVAGAPLARSDDISFELNGERYVIKEQVGPATAATIVRPGAAETIGSPVPYRRHRVVAVAELGLVQAHKLTVGQEFTLRELAGDEWESLSDVEQRNAGKHFRKLLKPRPLGNLDEWKTNDNEWHYRRL